MPSPFANLERPPLREGDLRKALVGAGGVLTDVRVVAETRSTNEDVAVLARDGAQEGAVVVAESQTAGRGRLGRVWVAPPRSGLTFSVLLRPTFVPSRWSWLPLAAGVAVATAVGRLSGLDVRLKWPNDVLVGERKLAGVLVEVVADAVVVGIGLNVSTRADELPLPSATSLALEGAEVVDRDPVLRAVLRALVTSYDGLRSAGGDADRSGLRTAYVGLCATLGRPVRVELPGGREVAGEAVDVDAEGRLLVRTPAGLEPVGAGDVVHVR